MPEHVGQMVNPRLRRFLAAQEMTLTGRIEQLLRELEMGTFAVKGSVNYKRIFTRALP